MSDDPRHAAAYRLLAQFQSDVRAGGRLRSEDAWTACLKLLTGQLDAADKAAGVYRVSLDAAVEAAAKDEFERTVNTQPWDTLPEPFQRGFRLRVEPIVRAAVTGGAQ